MRNDIVVAVDGPAGSGKTTVSKAVAKALEMRHFDTRATYRAMTVALLRRGVSLEDKDALLRALDNIQIVIAMISSDRNSLGVAVDGRFLNAELRSPEVNAAVAIVAAIPTVRTYLTVLQRTTIGRGGVVAEGRDIGTVVWPQAAVKIFLTADPEVRAQRRSGLLRGSETRADVARRDFLDSERKISPTSIAPDAKVIDSTFKSVDEVVKEVEIMVISARSQSR